MKVKDVIDRVFVNQVVKIYKNYEVVVRNYTIPIDYLRFVDDVEDVVIVGDFNDYLEEDVVRIGTSIYEELVIHLD